MLETRDPNRRQVRPKPTNNAQHWHAPAPCVAGASEFRLTPGLGLALRFRGPAWSSGSFFAMAVNNSRTFVDVLADVSKKSSPASLAYASASAVWITRLSGCSFTRSVLFPASAMTMFSFACLCNSLTHDFALSSDDYRCVSHSIT